MIKPIQRPRRNQFLAINNTIRSAPARQAAVWSLGFPSSTQSSHYIAAFNIYLHISHFNTASKEGFNAGSHKNSTCNVQHQAVFSTQQIPHAVFSTQHTTHSSQHKLHTSIKWQQPSGSFSTQVQMQLHAGLLHAATGLFRQVAAQ